MLGLAGSKAFAVGRAGDPDEAPGREPGPLAKPQGKAAFSFSRIMYKVIIRSGTRGAHEHDA